MTRRNEIEKNLESFKKLESNIIVVTKKFPIDDIKTLYALGQRDFGENRVSELVEKYKDLSPQGFSEVRWHFIGHLQRNKVRDLFTKAPPWAIHSVDSIRLVDELMNQAEHLPQGAQVRIFLQFQVIKEESKGGFRSVSSLRDALKKLEGHERLLPIGLMGMAPLESGPQQQAVSAHSTFSKLRELRDDLKIDWPFLKELSMGMSGDYKVALDEGSDWLRIGQAILGERSQ